MPPASPTLYEYLREAPFGLAMSSGFFGFFAHTGMLSALLERDVLPVRVSGSSAGALIGGLWASGLDPAQMRTVLTELKRADFWDPAPGLGVLRGLRFRALLERELKTAGFAATRVPFAASAFEPLTGRTEVLSQGALAPAIQASCAVPVMFHPVRIGRRFYLDGGIADRAGLLGMQRCERVFYHHLASRSPWRSKNSKALELPRRAGLVSLAIYDLPRAHPFALDSGRHAMELAYARTKQALDRPIQDAAVRM